MSAHRSLVFKTVSSLLGLVGLLTAIASHAGDDTHWGFGSAAHHVADDTHWGTPNDHDDQGGGPSNDDTHW